MAATALIVFREIFEVALVVGIVMAAARGIPARNLWIGAGLATGTLAAVVVAVFARAIAAAAAGMGQELFNAAVLFCAVVMLGWHNVWMSGHGRQMAQDATALGRDVRDHDRPIYALAVVAAVATLREGAEVVLFLYGIAAAQGTGTAAMLAGGTLGLALGGCAGVTIYFGLLRLPGGLLFTVTGWLILFLAAGMAAQGAAFLVQAGWLPALGQAVWDSSAVLSERGIVGNLLHALVGYTARPDGIQIVFYLATLTTIGALMHHTQRSRSRAAATVMIIAAAVAALTGVSPARAAKFKVYSPVVEQGEIELEARMRIARDNDDAIDNEQRLKVGVGYGITENWFTEIEGFWKKNPDGSLRYNASSWENVIQVLPQGKYWLDFGLFAEYEIADRSGDADKIEFGPLVQKAFGPVLATGNIIFEKSIGANADESTVLEYGVQLKCRYMPAFEPGFEVFGELGEIGNFNSPDRQDHRLGPAVFGRLRLFGDWSMRYEAAALFGMNDATADVSYKGLIELEHRF